LKRFTRRPFSQLLTESTTPLKDSFEALYLMLILDFSVDPPPGVGEVEGETDGLAFGLPEAEGDAAEVQFTIGTHDGGKSDLLGLGLGLVPPLEAEGDGDCWAGAPGAEGLPRWADAPTFSTRTTPATIAVVVMIIHFQDLAVCLLIRSQPS
jgi:hypothetical protein